MSSPVKIDVNGTRMRVRVEGSPDAPPLVLIHGIGRSIEDWSEQFPRLAAGHRLIAMDLPGSGFSERRPESTTLTVLAQAVVDLLDTLGEHRPVHLVGNSLGGAVAMQASVLAPDRVAGLVLVDSAGFGAEVALPLRLLTVARLGEAMTRRPTAGSAKMTERMSMADPRLATPTRIEHALAIAAQPDTGAVMLETARVLATMRGCHQAWRDDLLSGVAALNIPTLVMWGDKDKVLPVHHLRAARRAFPHAETRLFPGVGHMPQIETPDAFAARVTDFVRDVAAVRAPAETAAPAAKPAQSSRRRRNSKANAA